MCMALAILSASAMACRQSTPRDSPARAEPSTPNVVLLSIDSLSARHLPTYGYFRDTAPLLARELEAGGTVFDDCVAAATSTVPAHMSILTGLQPLEHGVTSDQEALRSSIQTVTEKVRAAGIRTAAFPGAGRLGPASGLGRDFDEYDETDGNDGTVPGAQVDEPFTAARTWLKRHASERFFLFILVGNRHALAPQYADLFPTDEQGAVIDESAPPLVRAAQLQDRAIRQIDDEIGALLAAIDELGLAENTVVILTSGHGTDLAVRESGRHDPSLREEIIHVPLLMRGPGVPRGLRIDAPVGHVDVTNTIASFLGVEPPRGSRGIDLRRTFGGNGAATDGAFYFTESPSGLAVRQGHRKVARYTKEDGSHWSECYDLVTDPEERINLCADQTSEPADLVATLDAYRGVTARRRAELIPTSHP